MTPSADDSQPSHDTGFRAETPCADAGDVHVRQDGPRGAPTLLLIHGSGSSARAWDAMVPLLTTSHHVVRVDLLGHGRSAKPADADYTIAAQAARVAAALDRLGVEQATVVGHSAGGYTATALAERRADLVAALVLINTGPRLEAYLPQAGGLSADQWSRLTDRQIAELMSTAFSRPGYQAPQEVLQDVRRMTYHSFTATMQASTDYLRRRPLPRRLSALDLPLSVIYGAEDRRWRPSSFAEYATVAGAAVQALPATGHSPVLEDPVQTAEHLLAFIATHTLPAE